MAIVKDLLGTITFKRATGKEYQTCDGCPDLQTQHHGTSMLRIELEQYNLTLCPFHEGMLLEKMLSNYLKRKARKSPAGYTGNLTKEIVIDA